MTVRTWVWRVLGMGGLIYGAAVVSGYFVAQHGTPVFKRIAAPIYAIRDVVTGRDKETPLNQQSRAKQGAPDSTKKDSCSWRPNEKVIIDRAGINYSNIKEQGFPYWASL